MAKVKPSIYFDEINGKLGNGILSKSHSEFTLRNFTNPRNPKSSEQQIIRSDFSALSSSWGQLTQAQIIAWNKAAKGILVPNKFGVKHPQTGFNLYMSQNYLPSLCGVGASVLPLTSVAHTFPTFTVTDNVVQNSITVNFSRALAANEFCVIKASPFQSNGKSATANLPMKIIKLAKLVDGSIFNIGPNWINHYGPLPTIPGWIYKNFIFWYNNVQDYEDLTASYLLQDFINYL